MKRILIIGCPGSGKTTLAVKLAGKLGLPLVHLDELFWRDGWTTVSKEEFDELLQVELEKSEWIIDGNYNRTIPHRLKYCDTVIWLDFPRHSCILGILKRVITNFGKTRPDMGNNCPERLDFGFMKYVWGFNKEHRKKYLDTLKSIDGVKVITLRSRKETEQFLKNL